ncbi:Cytochrome P450 monooxygenase [Pyrenophora teres f. teres]|uniref:Cytochrome P450 monooxygenase n=1 Tax=Pyrenophora teres f. teres TaxID=97479 RepID=A0A6S6VI35_9PLEO|nr:Cytochrome P450 monooxygenase [Pyrenophora teres f. teres]
MTSLFGELLGYNSFNVPSILAALLFSSIAAFVLRRRWLHPLSKYPGPLLNSLSEIPAAIALSSGRQQAYYRKLHSKYGDIVRVAPNELSFVNPDAWQDIHNRKQPHMEKHPVFIGAVPAVGATVGLSMARLASKDHSRQRKALGYSFTTSALIQQQAVILKHVRKLISHLTVFARDGKEIDMTDWYTYTTFDLMGDLALGEPFGCLDQNGPTEWSRAIIHVFVSGAWEQSIRRVAGIGTWLESALKKLLIPKKAALWRLLHFTKSKEATAKRIKDGERDHKDLMYFVLKNKEARQNLSDQEIMINMTLLLSAGSETTANTLTAWTYFACSDPKVYKRLVEEVRSQFKKAEDIVWENVQPNKLPYLEATIDEAMRLVPPPSASQQRMIPPGGAVICGEFIPEGYAVAIPPVAINRLDINFANPTEYRPERWLPRTDIDWDDRFAGDKLQASQPFSMGPRVCPGKQLAYFELLLILASMLWHFDMELANEAETKDAWTMDDDMRNLRGYLTWLKPALPIRLREVKRNV